MKTNFANAVLITGLILLASFSFAAGYFLNSDEKVITTKAVHIELEHLEASTTIPIAAVYTSNDGMQEGIISKLTVEIGDGKGRVLVNIDDVLAGTDTQESAKVATRAAEAYLEADFSNKDIIFTIESDEAGVVSGPSAGAAMAVALILTAEGDEINKAVAITGAIPFDGVEDGRIIAVSGILAKAAAAKEKGITVFLVPEGQSTQEACTAVDGATQCGVVDVKTQVGIDIIEVATLEEALKHFYM